MLYFPGPHFSLFCSCILHNLWAVPFAVNQTKCMWAYSWTICSIHQTVYPCSKTMLSSLLYFYNPSWSRLTKIFSLFGWRQAQLLLALQIFIHILENCFFWRLPPPKSTLNFGGKFLKSYNLRISNPVIPTLLRVNLQGSFIRKLFLFLNTVCLASHFITIPSTISWNDINI